MPRAVPEHHDVDRARFEREIVPTGRPAVLRELTLDWPLTRAGRTSPEALADWLRAHATEEPGEAWFGEPDARGRFDFDEAVSGDRFVRKMAAIDQMLDLIMRQRGSERPWAVYAGALPVAKHLPDFLDGDPMPLLARDLRMLVSLWLGNRTSTPAHWDLPRNLACVVAGRRRFTLFPPDQVANLYVGPIDRTLAGQPSSLVDVDEPDLDRFPRFAEAMEHAEIAELEPGDALYMPSLWWHAVRGRDELCAMVNFWWREGGDAVSPFQSLLHAAVTLGGVPAEERASWKAFFDHYVFHANGDPVEHLPPAARGVLGARPPELLQRVKRSLAAALGK